MQKLSEARHFKDISKNRNFQDISKNRTIFQKMHPHASDFCHQSCLPDSWWLASSIDQRPSRPTKEKMTSQQIKTNSYHILPCSDNNYQVQILTIHSPEVVQNQIYSEAKQKLARDSPIVVPELSEQSCKIARPDLTEAMDHSQVLQQKRSCNQPTWIRNQWKSNAGPFKNEPTNMNQKPMGIYAEPFKHESANMNQKLCTNNQNLSPQTCRQLKKTKAPILDQQSSTSRSPDAHIMASPPSSSQPWFLHSEEAASETPEAKPPAGKQLKKQWANKKKHITLQPMNSPRPGKSADQNLCH